MHQKKEMLFSTQRLKPDSPKLILANTEILFCEKVNYLGVDIYHKLRFEDYHIKNKVWFYQSPWVVPSWILLVWFLELCFQIHNILFNNLNSDTWIWMRLRTTQDFISAYDADKAWFKELIIEKKDWLTMNVHSSVQVDGQSISHMNSVEEQALFIF